MSNLKLPSLSFDSLHTGLRWAPAKTIAYATTARMTTLDGSPYIEVLHHGNVIATLQRDSVSLDTCGWDSRTTSQRLDRVLTDNGIPARVIIRQGRTCLVDSGDLRQVLVRDLSTITFTRTAGKWNATALAGVTR